MFKLTEGALDKIMNGIDIEEPVLQILGYKKLPSTKQSNDRYRLLVSDGNKLNSFTMLATQLNNLITDEIITEFAICKITKYALSSVNNNGKEKRVMLVLGVDLIVPGSEVNYKIGNPVASETKESNGNANGSANGSGHTNGNVNKPTSSTVAHQFQQGPSDIPTTPIAALSPYQNRWVIKARVTSKSAIRSWSNSRGEGKLFSFDLIDDSGEIRCTAFRDQCDKFYDMIETGHVYYFSRCTLKASNKKFNNLKNDFEMSMTNDTEIIPCHVNNDDIPLLGQFNFVPISRVEQKEKGDMIDVLGVVSTSSDLQHVTQRTTGRELMKRDVNIVDDSGVTVCVTLWGKQAEEFDGSGNPILAIKQASVSEFNGGKSLTLYGTSVIAKDPDIPEAHKLRGWYAAGGHAETARSLSKQGGGDFSAPLCTFKEVSDARLGDKLNIADTYSVVATINLIRVENSVYKACPTEGCKKKLIDQSSGIFRCEKCCKDFPNFIYRLIASMNIADATGSRWITAFNEDAEKILGMPAQELGELKENDNDAYMQKFGEASFKRFTFTIRARSEVFQDEMRVKHTCVSVTPLNYKTHLAHLIDKVSKLAHIEKIDSN